MHLFCLFLVWPISVLASLSISVTSGSGSGFASPSPSVVTPYLVFSDWSLTSSSSCDVTACCCFTSASLINIFPSPSAPTQSLLVNGSVAGVLCEPGAIVQSDTLDVPTSFTFHNEFFGVDDFVFTLANVTNAIAPINKYAWTLSARSSAQAQCSWSISRSSPLPLPPAPVSPPTSSPTSPPVTPLFVSAYLGSWLFDDTVCNEQLPTCCCLTGATPATITLDQNGAHSFIVTGTPSLGCESTSKLESDDFPWPLSGTAFSSFTYAPGLLTYNDAYNITLSTSTDLSVTSLTFKDLTRHQCSMRAVRQVPNSASGNDALSGGAIAGIVIAILVVVAVVTVGVVLWKRRAQALSQTSGSTQPLNTNRELDEADGTSSYRSI